MSLRKYTVRHRSGDTSVQSASLESVSKNTTKSLEGNQSLEHPPRKKTVLNLIIYNPMKLSSLSKALCEEFDKYYAYTSGVTGVLRLKALKDFLQSSHRQLIEAEIERKKGMFKNSNYPDDKVYNEARRQEYGHNLAIQKDIAYLEGELAKCKELMK